MLANADTRWYPIAAAHDLPFRHVFHGQLLGREFAVWRADDGYVNVWENRCLHRGLRLSIGVSDGRELKCQYHGWRYANRTAGCTYIPAHPADAPARTITTRTFPAAERYGLVWSSLDPAGEEPAIAALEREAPLVLRGIPVNVSASEMIERLKDYRFEPVGSDGGGTTAQTDVEDADDLGIVLRARRNGAEMRAVFLVQPVDAGRCVIRGVVDCDPNCTERLAVLRHHNERLSRLRDDIEREAAERPAAPPVEPVFERVRPELAEMPQAAPAGRKAAFSVQVARKWRAGEGIAGFELRPLRGHLPSFQPGAHIDVHLPNGVIRQYSLTNGPGESESFVIGVKRETPSGGGSQCLHDVIRDGDVLAISEPRNNFPLRRDATRTLFIAGGIGITPLLAMAQTLHHSSLIYELHYFATSQEHLAFPERLAGLGDGLRTHIGLSPEATNDRLNTLLSDYRPRIQLYVCGPGAMLDATRRIASECGWPDSAVHFEYFKNPRAVDDSTSFEVALARSCVTITVPPGKSILQAVRENGIDIASSCEQGACGTCSVTVIDGEPDHQDVYLNDTERRSRTKIITCVSRAKSARLVLDL
jgi:ferredoxin-NADP reductase/nitrite reductase/ring-hydroxylating ferredoxin subunit